MEHMNHFHLTLVKMLLDANGFFKSRETLIVTCTKIIWLQKNSFNELRRIIMSLLVQ